MAQYKIRCSLVVVVVVAFERNVESLYKRVYETFHFRNYNLQEFRLLCLSALHSLSTRNSFAMDVVVGTCIIALPTFWRFARVNMLSLSLSLLCSLPFASLHIRIVIAVIGMSRVPSVLYRRRRRYLPIRPKWTLRIITCLSKGFAASRVFDSI